MNNLVKKGIASVTVVLCAFGSAALKIQPPGDGVQKSIGFIVSFGLLLILLIISALSDYFQVKKMKLVWIGLGLLCTICFIIFGLYYSTLKQKYVVAYPNDTSETYIIGNQLDIAGLQAKDYLIKSGKAVNNHNLIWYGGSQENIQNIWKQSSIEQITTQLIKTYILVMVLLTIGIFSITEGVFKSLAQDQSEENKIDGK